MMFTAATLLLAIVYTWWLLKAVFLPKTQVEDDAAWLEREHGFTGPENEREAEEHRVEFMPVRLLCAAAAWLLFAGSYKAGL